MKHRYRLPEHKEKVTIKNCWYYDILKHSTKACNVNTSKDVDWKKKCKN